MAATPTRAAAKGSDPVTTSALNRVRETLEITNVRDVAVTPVTADGGQFVRTLKIYGEPGGRAAAPVLELVIKSATASDLNVPTPELEF